MKFFKKVKDGGPKSNVDSYVLVEIKSLFSIMLLKFNKGQRDSYHSHAFNAVTWFIKGKMSEDNLGKEPYTYKSTLLPKYTTRNQVHIVIAHEDSWAFTIRGPWTKTWYEINSKTKKKTTMTNKRRIVCVE